MTITKAREIAARIWCDPEMEHRAMDYELAEAIALLLLVAFRDSDDKEPSP